MQRLYATALLLFASLPLTHAAPLADDALHLWTDVPYADTTNRQQTLDLAVPRARTGPLPLIVFVHGGAWQGGRKQDGYGLLDRFVRSGRFAVASVEYRFSQHAIWPAQIHDCKAAIRWLRGNAAGYGINPDRIAVWGASAGGHLVAMLGTSGGQAELEGTLGRFTNASSRVRCVVDFFGPSDFVAMAQATNDYRHGERDAPVPRLLGGLMAERLDAARSASPASHATPDDPPFLIVHGTQDQLVPISQSETLARALTEAGVKSPPILIRMVGAGHGFQRPELDARIAQFFEQHLYDAPGSVSDQPI